ncbi:hypothetical protein EE612_045725, partial [Oryza sativa]
PPIRIDFLPRLHLSPTGPNQTKTIATPTTFHVSSQAAYKYSRSKPPFPTTNTSITITTAPPPPNSNVYEQTRGDHRRVAAAGIAGRLHDVVVGAVPPPLAAQQQAPRGAHQVPRDPPPGVPRRAAPRPRGAVGVRGPRAGPPRVQALARHVRRRRRRRAPTTPPCSRSAAAPPRASTSPTPPGCSPCRPRPPSAAPPTSSAPWRGRWRTSSSGSHHPRRQRGRRRVPAPGKYCRHCHRHLRRRRIHRSSVVVARSVTQRRQCLVGVHSCGGGGVGPRRHVRWHAHRSVLRELGAGSAHRAAAAADHR